MSKPNLSGLAERMKNMLNKNSDREMAKSFSSASDLMQVKSWIPLKPFFKEATGGEGFPCGHITQIIGKPDSGKTTLIMEGMVATQKAGGVAFLIDSEHKFSLGRLALMGGVPEDVVVMQVDNLEQAWDAIYRVCESVETFRKEGSTAPMMMVWDSVAASVPQKILDSEAGDAHMAVEAKINNKNVRKLRAWIKTTELACVFINHFYMTVPKSMYEQPELVVKGGEELSFFSTLIIKTKRGAKIDREIDGQTQTLGRMTKFEVHKGHFHGRTIVKNVHVVDLGILETKEELDAYKKTLRGKL
jgi:RecA/RadA recombinase